MNFKLPGLFIFLFLVNLPVFGAISLAPSNDDCSRAYPLRNVSNYCSSPRQFTNVDATASGYENPGCFPDFLLEPDNDVWFKFTAKANTANISVIGALYGNPKGTLQYPQFALYRGTCNDGLLEIACISDVRGYNIVETFINDLAIGGTYYLRVDGRNGKTGTFQLCVNNYNPVPSPSSDCSSAVVLCDKSSFTVPNVIGAGRNRYELTPGICLQEETSSAWYKWTCDKPGTLTFTLTPVNPSDDIDFAVFYLPNGVDDCSVKIPYRCMASGENAGNSFAGWARCTGATGLKSSSGDISEEPGCSPNDDNFVAAMKMEAGESFALLINNFHNTGNGFSIKFGGTGTFKGPVAHFVVNKLKLPQDKELWVRNKSSFDGGIKNWEWNFGVDAKPATAKGVGPHKVRYGSTGKKSISLSIETGNGCQVTKVRNVTIVEPPPPPPEPEPEPVPVVKEPEPPPVEPAPEALPTGTASTNGFDLGGEEGENIDTHSNSDEKKTTPADTVYVPVTYHVKFTGTIYFASDSFALDDDDKEILVKILGLLQTNPDYQAIVEGHTNNIPDNRYCKELAADRAASVITWLKNHGISEDRIIRKVLGKDRVFEKEETKYKNRKIHQKAVIKLVQRE